MKEDPYGTGNLFDPEPFQATGKGEKTKVLKSVAQGNCSMCSKEKVGLIYSDGHLMWRYHTYKTHGGTSLPCGSVGVYVCQCPEGMPPYSADGIAVRCPHGRNG